MYPSSSSTNEKKDSPAAYSGLIQASNDNSSQASRQRYNSLPNSISRQSSMEVYNTKSMPTIGYSPQHARQYSNSQAQAGPSQGWASGGYPGNYTSGPPEVHPGAVDPLDVPWNYGPHYDKNVMGVGGHAMPYCPSPTGSQSNNSLHSNALPPSHMSSNNGLTGQPFSGSAPMPQPMAYSNGGSPILPSIPPGYSEATAFAGPLTSGTAGPNNYRPHHQKTSSGNSSFATCISEGLANSGQPGQEVEVRRLHNMLQEEVRRSKKEQQQLRGEVLYYRSKLSAAAAEKRAILNSYKRDVLVLVDGVDALLTTCLHHGNNGAPGGEGDAPPLESVRDASSAKRIALLSKAIQRNHGAEALKGVNERQQENTTDSPDYSNASQASPESRREISNALRLRLDEGGWGMTLLKCPEEHSMENVPYSGDHGAAEEACLDEEEYREIAVEAQRSVEAYLQSLNYGFPYGPHSRAPLAVQIPVPSCHPFLGGGGGTASQ